LMNMKEFPHPDDVVDYEPWHYRLWVEYDNSLRGTKNEFYRISKKGNN